MTRKVEPAAADYETRIAMATKRSAADLKVMLEALRRLEEMDAGERARIPHSLRNSQGRAKASTIRHKKSKLKLHAALVGYVTHVFFGPKVGRDIESRLAALSHLPDLPDVGDEYVRELGGLLWGIGEASAAKPEDG